MVRRKVKNYTIVIRGEKEKRERYHADNDGYGGLINWAERENIPPSSVVYDDGVEIIFDYELSKLFKC